MKYIKKFIDFESRSSRREFFICFIIFVPIQYIIHFSMINIFHTGNDIYYSLPEKNTDLYYNLIKSIFYLFHIIFAIPLVSVSVRRIHDVGYTGLLIIPILIGFLMAIFFSSRLILQITFIIFFIIIFQKPNTQLKFGKPPKK